MSNGYLIVLGAGPDQVPAYTAARQLGIKTVSVDYNPSAPAFAHADICLVASVKDTAATITALRELGETYLGVMTLGVEISPVVAAVAKEFDLTAVSEETAYLTTNKCARNQRLRTDAIPIPDFQVVSSMPEIVLPYPFVIKPSDNSASRGVRRVDNDEELADALAVARQLSSDGQVLVEQLLEGPEISIEGFMLDGKMYVTGFADRNYRRNPDFYPYFVEDGGESPSALSEDIQQEAQEVFERAALSLGILNGPSKGDLIVHKGSVYVLEITSRLSGGGFCSRIVPLEKDIDIVSATAKWAAGMQVLPSDFQPMRQQHVVNRFFFHNPGRITAIAGLERLKEMPGITDVVIQRPFKVGDILEPVSYANRLFYVIAVADDRETAVRCAENAIGSVRIEVE